MLITEKELFFYDFFFARYIQYTNIFLSLSFSLFILYGLVQCNNTII